jgi:hypothetical protein
MQMPRLSKWLWLAIIVDVGILVRSVPLSPSDRGLFCLIDPQRSGLQSRICFSIFSSLALDSINSARALNPLS